MMNSIVEENMEWISWKAASLTHNREDAKELASETIFKCLINAEKYNPARPFRPWVTAVMTNILRTTSSRATFSDIALCGSMVSNADSSQYLIIHSMLKAIRRCARKSCCIECVLMYAKGYSYEEISVATGITLNTVKSRIAAGRVFLRRCME